MQGHPEASVPGSGNRHSGTVRANPRLASRSRRSPGHEPGRRLSVVAAEAKGQGMLLTDKVAGGVAAGSVSLAFRTWAVARIRAGDEFLTSAGVVAVTEVRSVMVDDITEDDARASGAGSREALLRSFRSPAPHTLFRVELRWAGPDPREALARDASLTDDDRADITARLDRLDRHSPTGPWTRITLETIRDRPGEAAEKIRGDVEKAAFKRNVHKLRNLGLSTSLTVGYALSPRGAAFLEGCSARDR